MVGLVGPRRSVLLALAVATAVASGGCGGDDEDDEGGSAQTSEQPARTTPDTVTGGAAGGGKAVRVGMEDIQYVPKEVEVRAGGTVRWTNSDSVPHTVTKQGGPGAKFDSGTLQVGATFEQKFARPGKVDYVCRIHPNQMGTVTVE